MDLLDRYLQSVRFFLPRHQQDDIVRELSENLHAQIEDREEALGRPLSEDEVADILRRHGHPMLVAGRYRSRQQLIGPVFFPIYLLTLQAGLALALIVPLLVAIAGAVLAGDSLRQAGKSLAALPTRALMVFAWTTLTFAALDYFQSRLKLAHNWDPRHLPRVVRAEYRISRLSSASEFLFSLFAVCWLLLLPQTPALLLGPAAAFLELTDIWRTAYAPMLVLTLANTGLSLYTFLRPYWTPGRSFCRIALQSGSLLLFALLLRGSQWVAAKPGVASPGGASFDRVVGVLNASFQIGLFVACLIAAVEIFREVRRLQSRRHPSAGPASAAVPR